MWSLRNLVVAIAIAAFCSTAVMFSGAAQSSDGKGKYLIILQAGKESHEGMARAVHALLYTRELKDHGHEAVLVFDGAGTEWAEEWTDPESTHKLTPLYRELRKLNLTEVICDFCANAFAVKKELRIARFRWPPSIRDIRASRSGRTRVISW